MFSTKKMKILLRDFFLPACIIIQRMRRRVVEHGSWGAFKGSSEKRRKSPCSPFIFPGKASVCVCVYALPPLSFPSLSPPNPFSPFYSPVTNCHISFERRGRIFKP